MKKLLLIIIIPLTFMVGCMTQKDSANKPKTELKPEKNDDGEWELMVYDTQYDYFLNAIAKPKNFYSESMLKSRNAFLVSEWNSLYYSGKYRNVIESSISYNQTENYGFEFEYRLFQVFAYVQWKYGLKLNGLSQSEIR